MIKPNGFALVLVLWVITLLALMAGSFALTMRRETAVISGIKENAQALALAESGLAMAEIMLLNQDPEQRWLTNGSIYEIDFPEGRSGSPAKIRIRLLAEKGKIDVNFADQELLQALMSHAPTSLEVQEKIVNAILDWRDEDDLERVNGAEAKEYLEAGLDYKPTNKAFGSLEEVQKVLNMTPEIFNWLASLITVYSGQKTVDIKQASREVLNVLPDLDNTLAQDFTASQRAQVEQAAVKSTLGTGKTSPSASKPVTAPNTGSASNPAEEGKPDVLTIMVEAQLVNEDEEPSAAPRSSLSVVLKKTDEQQLDAFEVLKWQRNFVNQLSLFGDTTEISNQMDELLVARYVEPEFNN
ncbi:MAG: type II secretion system protein GspK [Methylococcaceae bacterium]|jgi:general secretion pathway protein K